MDLPLFRSRDISRCELLEEHCGAWRFGHMTYDCCRTVSMLVIPTAAASSCSLRALYSSYFVTASVHVYTYICCVGVF